MQMNSPSLSLFAVYVGEGKNGSFTNEAALINDRRPLGA